MPSPGYYKYDLAYGTLYQLYIGERLSSAEIGRRLNVPQNTVNRYLRKLGLSDPNRRRDQTGFLNTNWKGGSSRSTVNRRTRDLCIDNEVSLYICEVCKKTFDTPLNRHHVDRNRANNVIHNILVACPSCHAAEHAKERLKDERGRYL